MCISLGIYNLWEINGRFTHKKVDKVNLLHMSSYYDNVHIIFVYGSI